MRILANDGISDKSKSELIEDGFEVITDNIPQNDLVKYINENNISILLVRSATKVRKDIIDSCDCLKMIGRGGVGMDNIDVEYARENGKIVFNTPASSSQSVAELVIGNMFAISRFIGKSSKNISTNDFNKLKKEYGSGVELRGKTLGIVGFGRIGQTLASYALGMGMNVLAVDIDEREVFIKLSIIDSDLKISIKTKNNIDDILPFCDYISLHVPKQPNGSSVITKREFEMMKDGVRIINSSRGGVVNEDDLLEYISSGKVFGAALDVFENEPNPMRDILENENILCTPHIGAATLEAQERIGDEIVEIIKTQYPF